MYPHILRLVRWPNLLIIILTMLGVQYGIFASLWKEAVLEMVNNGFLIRGLTLHLPAIDFWLLTLAIVCIASAGNIINDYFDTKTDRLNKPEKVVVGRLIARRSAMVLHLTLNGIGLLIGLYLSFKVGNWRLSGIFIFSILVLWFYSTHFKKQLLSGNILISILAALVPITVGLFEFSSGAIYDLNVLNLSVSGFGNLLLQKAAFILLGFAGFAFLINLVREIVKDIEDIEGDYGISARTLPIVVGETQAKYLAISITLFIIVLLGFVLQYLFNADSTILFWYVLLAVQLPLALIIVTLFNAYEKKHYRAASMLCKLVIVSGVLSMFIYRIVL